MKKISLLALGALMCMPLAAQQRKAVQVPASGTGSSELRYELRVDDILLGEHESDYTIWNERDANGSITGTDHRSRSHTVSAWIRRGLSSTGRIMGLTRADQYRLLSESSWSLHMNGTIRYRTGVWHEFGGTDVCPAEEAKTEKRMAQNEWAFMTVVIDDDNLLASYYMNGALLGQQKMDTYNDMSPHNASTTHHYGIGLYNLECMFTFGHANLDIAVEEIQVWNRALSAYEVRKSADLDTNSDMRDEGLVGLFHMDPSLTEFPNEIEGPQAVNAIMVQGSVTQAGNYTYYNNVKKAVTPLEFVDGHELGDKTVSVTQPAAGGSISVLSGRTGEPAGESLRQYTPLRLVAAPAEGFQLKNYTVKYGEISEVFDRRETEFVLIDNSEVTAEFTDQINAEYTATKHGRVQMSVTGPDGFSEDNSCWFDRGSELQIRLFPESGYFVKSVKINGNEFIDYVFDNRISLPSVDQNVKVDVVFRSEKATIAVNGTLRGGLLKIFVDNEESTLTSGALTAKIGSKIRIIPQAEENKALWAFTVNGVDCLDKLVDGVYTIDRLDDDLSIVAEFRNSHLKVGYTSNEGGWVTMSVNDGEAVRLTKDGVNVPINSSLVFTVVPVNGDSRLKSLKLNGQDLSGMVFNNQLALTVGSDDIDLDVEFDVKEYDVEISVEGREFGDPMLECMENDRIYNTLNERVTSGTHLTLTVFLSDSECEIKSATEGDKSLPVSYYTDSADGSYIGRVDLGTVTSSRHIDVVLGKKSSINGVETDGNTVVVDGTVVMADGAVAIAAVDMTGAVVAEQKGESLDLGGLSVGIYIVRVTYADGNTQIIKFVSGRK